MLIAVAPLVLEGEYTTWTAQWTINHANNHERIHGNAFFNGDETYINLPYNNSLHVVKVSDGLTSMYAALSEGDTTTTLYDTHSILGTYFAVLNEANTQIRIIRDNAVLQTLNPDVAGDGFNGCLMSPCGKYLFVIYYDVSEVDKFEYRLYAA